VSYGWVFGVIGLTIFCFLMFAAWLAERHEHKAWWREPKQAEWRNRW
jgi:hypothetical protein